MTMRRPMTSPAVRGRARDERDRVLGDDPSTTASESSTTTSESSTTTTEAPDDGPTTLARGDDVEIGGFGGLVGQTLNIDAVEQDGEVTGEFRVNNVVVTLQCADTMATARSASAAR